MPVKLKNLNFKYGAIVDSNSSNKNKSKLSFAYKKISAAIYSLQITIKNTNSRPIKLNAFWVDFELLDFKPNQILQNGWGQSSFSGYRGRIIPTRENLLFSQRNQNPYSFNQDFGALKNSMVSEWYTQLTKNEQAFLIGAATYANQYCQIFLKQLGNKTSVRVTCQLDKIRLSPQKTLSSEKIVLITGTKQNTLEQFANLLTKFNRVRLSPIPPRGICCAYYSQGNQIDKEYIFKQLSEIDKYKKQFQLKYLLIDSGYCEWGDWLDNNQKFPGGMKKIVKEIRKHGLKAGIWLAPIIASPKSRLFKNHPDWFLKTSQGNFLEGRLLTPIDSISKLSLRVLDPTLPQVRQMIKKVVRKFISDGFELVKIDFAYPLGFAERFSANITRAQALRELFSIIRQSAGPKTHILSSLSQLSPLAGIVDSARVGLDTLNPTIRAIPILAKIINRLMLKKNIRNCISRQFLNRKIWFNDADCLVYESGTGLNLDLIDSHIQLLKTYKGSFWLGDDLKKISQQELINRFFQS